MTAQSAPRAPVPRVFFSAELEDTASEAKALAIGPSTNLLCLTASGSRVLDLLVEGPRRALGIDWNPAQTALAELKVAGIRDLEREPYLRFIGVLAAADRIETYGRLRGSLSAAARAYWDARPKVVASGIQYCGVYERCFQLCGALGGVLMKRDRERLFSAPDVAAQLHVWRERWARGGFRLFLRLVASRSAWRFAGDPGVKFIPPGISPAEYFLERLDRAAASVLFRDCPAAWLLFYGRYPAEGPLPRHMQPNEFERLKALLPRLEFRTIGLEAFLASPEASRFDAWSLSDFSSYATHAQHAAIWRQLARVLPPGAAVCERRFLVKFEPEGIAPLKLDRALAAALDAADRSFVYDFNVARSAPDPAAGA